MLKLYYAEADNAKAHSRSFAKSVLGESLNVGENEIVIQEDEYGKPYVRDYKNVHYNISHTQGAIICAVAYKPVGVDIERVRRLNRRIVERYFTQNEQDYVLSEPENQDERFTEVWTRKEAYAKWLGKGLAVGFDSFDALKKDIYTIFYGGYFVSICGHGDQISDLKLIRKNI